MGISCFHTHKGRLRKLHIVDQNQDRRTTTNGCLNFSGKRQIILTNVFHPYAYKAKKGRHMTFEFKLTLQQLLGLVPIVTRIMWVECLSMQGDRQAVHREF